MIKEIKVPELLNPVKDASRRAWLAGLGAVALAQDEILDFANRLVERGAITEKDGRKLVNDLMAWPQKNLKMAEGEIQHQIEAVLCRFGVLTRADIEKMNLPTKADIQALAEKVQALSKKVDQLRKEQEPQAEKTEALAGKVQAVSRKVSQLQKAVEEETPNGKEKEKEKAKEKEPARRTASISQPPAAQNTDHGAGRPRT